MTADAWMQVGTPHSGLPFIRSLISAWLSASVCPAPSAVVIDVASRGHGGERVFDSLHRAWVDVELHGNAADGFSGLYSGKDSLFEIGIYSWPSERFALILSPPEPSADSFLNHRPFKLGKHAHHLKHCLAAGRGRVQTLLMQE